MVVRLSIVLVTICLLKVNGISIPGTNSTTYDPANPPLRNRFTCQNGEGNAIEATWTRDNNPVEPNLVQGGRLVLEQGTIATTSPQMFEGRYRCHSNGDSSRDLYFYVAPSRVPLNSSTVYRELEGQNVTIDCPLHFGILRDGWSVEWTAQDSQGNLIHPNEYFIRRNPNFQLVIKKVSIHYEEAKFECHALRDDRVYQESQPITLNVFHEPQITSRPNDPFVINFTHGIVNYEIKAYPRPTVRFCYNDTCINTNHGRIQITNHQNNDTSHTAQFTINSMTEADNGNVTFELSQSERNFTKNYTVMLFLPYKLRLTKNGSITNGQIPLLIFLRKPLYFQYHIDFADMENKLLSSMEGIKGQMTFTHMLAMERDTDVIARFRIGEVSGPDSDPVTVDVDVPISNNTNIGGIVGGIMGGIVLLSMIITFFCIVIVCHQRWCHKTEDHVYEEIHYDRTKLNTHMTVRLGPSYDAAKDETGDSIVMNTNPSYEESIRKERQTSFSTIAIDSDTKAHQSSEYHDYDNVHDDSSQLHHTDTPGDENDDVAVQIHDHNNVDQKHNTEKIHSPTKPTNKGEYGVINQPQCDDPNFDITVDLSCTTESPIIASTTNDGKYGVINQPRCDDPNFDITTVDQSHITESSIIASTTNDGKYGVINQPQCNDPCFDITDDKSHGPKHCSPIIAKYVKFTDEGKYGVINQPQCDDPNFDITVDLSCTTESPIIASTTNDGKYGVINQPRCDDPNFDITTVDQSHITESSIIASTTNDDKYGVINQPQCNDPCFDITDDKSHGPKHCSPIIAKYVKFTDEGKYGVINQPQCDDPNFDITADQSHTTESPVIITKLIDEGKYGIIDQSQCNDLNCDITVGQSPTTKSCLPLIANDADESEYGVINQPQCDDII